MHFVNVKSSVLPPSSGEETHRRFGYIGYTLFHQNTEIIFNGHQWIKMLFETNDVVNLLV